MAKKHVPMKDLGKQHIKDALRSAHPFLRGKLTYRTLTDADMKNEKAQRAAFKDLFGEDEKFELYKLKAVYAYQN